MGGDLRGVPIGFFSPPFILLEALSPSDEIVLKSV